MSAATTILARIRAANAGNAPPAAVPRHYLGAGQRSTDDLVARFAARVEDYRAEVRICAPEALAETLGAVLGDAPIDLVVGLHHGVLVVLDNQQRIAQIAQVLQGADQAVVVFGV